MELTKLEELLDKIISKTEQGLLLNLKKTLNESKDLLSKSYDSLESEYDKIMNDGKKESEKLEKQIIGSAEIESRNKQLLLIEEYIEIVFKKVIQKLGVIKRDDSYLQLMLSLVNESINTLGTSEIEIFVNDKDNYIVKSILKKFSKIKISSDKLNCIGGIKAKTMDGTMMFDNTIDSRLTNMKPLIRKEIATKFGVDN